MNMLTQLELSFRRSNGKHPLPNCTAESPLKKERPAHGTTMCLQRRQRTIHPVSMQLWCSMLCTRRLFMQLTLTSPCLSTRTSQQAKPTTYHRWGIFPSSQGCGNGPVAALRLPPMSIMASVRPRFRHGFS